MRERGGASGVDEYVHKLFGTEDEVLKGARKRAQSINPDMLISATEGKMLGIYARMIQAKKIVEVGAFTGYSAICLGRSLPEDGLMYTCEFSPEHARLTNESLKDAGLSHKVKVLEGEALKRLHEIEKHGPFDLIFIDADKGNYYEYLLWAEQNIRIGGLIIGDNTKLFGTVHLENPPEGTTKKSHSAMRNFNSHLAHSENFLSVMVPTVEGMTLGFRLK